MGNPTGGAVVAGSATIGAAGPTLTVNQSTQSAIINWQTFSIANGETTKFIVPNSGAATLNRVAAGNPSQIYGNLQSNGILYLVNPSGIVVGPNGRIDTAGFMASTLDVSNQQFLKGGDLNFAGNSDASIDNAGTIHASMGDVYLIANQVNNTGKITAPQGTVGLAAGNDVLFQQAGNQHLFVQATPAGTKRATGVTNAGTIRAAAAELKAAGGNAYALAINNTGVIAATGYKKVNGQVYLTSDGGSIGNSGKISAKQANGNGGMIALTGTSSTAKTTANTVTNSGTLDASASIAGGTGGSISVKNMTGATVHSGAIIAQGGQGGAGGMAEVSGHTVGFTGTVDLTAAGGKTGNLLIDPTSLDVITGGTGTIVSGQNDSTSTSIDPSAVVAALNTADVTLNADNTLNIDNAITWTSINTLTLSTNNTGGSSININAPITGMNGTLVIDGATGGSSTILTGSAGAINVGSFVMLSGSWNQLGTLPAFTAGDFELQGGSFLRATGGNGLASTPYQIADVYGLQGMGSFTGGIANNNFALVNNIDATGTSAWNGGAGFTPIGIISNQFDGSFDGANFVINGLHIDLPNSTDSVGLFGYAAGGLFQRVGLTNANITAGSNASGGLIGFLNNGTVEECYITGSVSASSTNGDETGGLVGGMNGFIEQSYSSANVSGGNVVGGIVGVVNSGSVTSSYATGNVTGIDELGGLIGSTFGATTESYSSGLVTGGTAGNSGAFIGLNLTGAAVTSCVADDTINNGRTFVGSNGSGSVTNSLYGATSQLLLQSTYSGIGWSIGINPSTTTWVSLNGSTGSTRPMLSMEYSGTINTAHSLELVGLSTATLSGGYTLGQNIDASGILNPSDVWGASLTNGQPGFFPIGNVSGTFRGDFNGEGHTIDSLYSHNPTSSAFVGLFGETSSGASIENVGLTNVSIVGGEYSGGLVGIMGTGQITNSYTTGTVNSQLANFGAGGLVGELLSGGTIAQSYSTAVVSGPDPVGGLVGLNGGTVMNSYSTGSVTGSQILGGLVGDNTGTITNSYTTSTVIKNAGGSGATSGGFVGSNSGTLHNDFWDTDSAGSLVVSGVGSDSIPNTTSGVVQATTAQLQTENFINVNSPTFPAWDFTTVWTTAGDTLTPQLQGLPTTPLPTGGGATDTLSGTAFTDSGLTAAGAGLTIDVLSAGSIIGSTTTLSGGLFTLSLSSTQLTNGVLLTDAVDNGNTYYQANSPAATISGIDIWGATLRLMGDTATTTALTTAKGSATNGINYTVSGTFLSTTAGVNLNILSNYALDGVTAANDITVNHALTSTTSDLSVLIAGRNVTVNNNITNTGGGGITLQAGNLNNGVGTVAFGAGATVSTSGPVTIFYNPSVNPSGSAVNTTSYVNPTENYAPHVTGGGALTAFMLVNTLNDLQNVQNNLTGTYALSQNIDATATGGWNSGAGFVPIGHYDGSDSSDANTFSGNFNGQGHTINGLTSNRPASVSGTGLFGDTATAGFIENLNLTNATITGTNYVGVAAGVDNATVTNVTTSGVVTGTDYTGGLFGITSAIISMSSSAGTVIGNSGGNDVGGLIGFEQGGTVTNTFSSANVIGFTSTGGLVGNNRGTIQLSYSTGSVTAMTGFDAVGGLVGYNSAGTIEQSYSTSTVTASGSGNYLGGFAGFNATTIDDSYAAGPVTGATSAQDVGGFIGTNFGTLHNTYSTGLVTANGATNVGGFAGHTQTTIQNSFFDTDSSGQTQSIGDNFNNTDVDNVTTAQLTSQSFVAAHSPTAPTFDFTNIWTTVGDTLTPQIIGLPHTARPVGGSGDMLSGTAFIDSGVTAAGAGLTIDAISAGSIIGSTTTNSLGAFSFSFTSVQVTTGILLTDPTDKGNTFYQANTPASSITGIDLWGSTVRVSADATSNSALATTAGGVSGAGVQYTVVANNALATLSGVNFNNLRNYTLDGNVTAHDISIAGTVTSTNFNLTNLSATRNIAITGSITNSSGGGFNLISDSAGTGVGTVTFGGGSINTAGPVTIFYNPSVNPAGSAVNTTSYVNPTENFAPNVTGGATLTAYMLVNTLNDLQNVQNNLAGNYALSQNIDATATASWNSGAGFVPIGTDYHGIFNGQGFTIDGLTIHSTNNFVGLFGSIAAPGVIENVGLTNVNISDTHGEFIAALVGALDGSGTVRNSYSTGTVSDSGAGFFIGGLIGDNNQGTVSQVYSTVTVSAAGSIDVGGLIGANVGSLTNAYAAGAVTGGTSVGGFVGENTTGTIHNAYSTGLVIGTTSVGAFIGKEDVGGGAITNTFWDTDSSGQSVGVGSGTVAGLVAATTAQLQSQSFITAHATTAPVFDFTNVWNTAGGTLTPQLNGLPQTPLPNSGPLDVLDGTAFSDSGGLNFSSGVLIDLISGGSVIGSTTTNGSGAFTFNVSSGALSNGVLLTDATDKGNTFYQDFSPASTIRGIDIWGSTVRVSATAATNASLATAIGSLPMVANGINYSVAAGALTTTAGENFTILTNYTLDGNITAHGVFTTVNNTFLDGSANVNLTGTSVAMAGTFDRTGPLTITSTSGQIALTGVGDSSTPGTAAATALTLNSAQAVLMSNTFLAIGNGGLTATGTGYTSTTNTNGEANGINLFDTSIFSSGNISLTGTSGYTSNGNGGISSGLGVFIGTDGVTQSLISASGMANLSITGTVNSNITSTTLLAGVLIQNDVGSASNSVSVADGRLTITGTVSQGTTTADSVGVDIESGPEVEATGAGLVTITGTESSTSATNRAGIRVAGGSNVSLVDGALNLNGTATRGTAQSSIGVSLTGGSEVASTGLGSVSVTGNTTGSSASFNAGVYSDDATLASSGASGLAVNGNAGAVTGATPVIVNGSSYNPTSAGIFLTLGSSLSTTNTGGIRLMGVAGPNDSTAPLASYGADTGVRFQPSGGAPVTVTSAGGGIAITGTSGAGAGTFFNVGVNVSTATIQDTGDGAVTVTGIGGAGQADNSGVAIEGAGTTIQAGNGGGSSGVLTIIGHGGAGVTGSQNDGISIFNAPQLVSGGAGIVLTGSTGTAGSGSSGVIVSTASLTTANGPLAINSTGGGLSIGATLTALTTAYSTPAGTSATLSNLNSSTTLSGGNFFITQSGNLVLNAMTVQSLSLDVTGSITQIGRIAAGQLSITNAGSVTLTNASNVLSSLGAVSSSGAIDIFTDPGLTLTSTVTSGSAITIAETGGPLTLGANAQVIETGTANVILAAGTNLANSNYFVNDSSAGANAVQTGSFGRFFLFSSDPTYNSLGGITFAPANMVYNAVYPTSASTFTGSGNAEFFYVAGSGQVGPNAPVTTQIPNTTTGGAADGGSNIVPPVLTVQTAQIDPQTQGDGTTVGSPTNFLPNGGADENGNQPPPFSFTGTGVSQLLGQTDGGLANSASNSGLVNTGDIALLNNGQYRNVTDPQATDIMDEALGPIVYQNLADALRALGDWADVPDKANDTEAAGAGETILTGGDVAEMTGTSAKKIPLSQAPEQLQNAMKDDSLKDAGH